MTSYPASLPPFITRDFVCVFKGKIMTAQRQKLQHLTLLLIIHTADYHHKHTCLYAKLVGKIHVPVSIVHYCVYWSIYKVFLGF